MSCTCTMATQVEMFTSKRLANRKGWGWKLSAPPQVLPNNIMAESNRSLLPYSTRYMPCSMVANFLLPYKLAYEPKLLTLPLFLKIISSLPNEIPFQHFFGKRKRNILSLIRKFCEMCITIY